MTAQDYAKQFSSAFETLTRDNGDKIFLLKDGSPEWMIDVCHTAHADGSDGGMLPDDWRYRFISEAANILSDTEENEWDDVFPEADIYTHDLLSWLASRNDRMEYCDNAAQEYGWSSGGKFGGTSNLISMGQAYEKQEVFSLVRMELQELVEG